MLSELTNSLNTSISHVAVATTLGMEAQQQIQNLKVRADLAHAVITELTTAMSALEKEVQENRTLLKRQHVGLLPPSAPHHAVQDTPFQAYLFRCAREPS